MTRLRLLPSVSAKVSADIHGYWLAKRARMRKPLLRRYWALVSANDSNPHVVFRPRERAGYKLRKHRKNDMEAYRKVPPLATPFLAIPPSVAAPR